MSRSFARLIVVLGVTANASLSTGQVVYVDAGATGTATGTSWCNAHQSLQDAILSAAASGGALDEIHVAQGVYRPDAGAGFTPGNRTATFTLFSGVAILGGYAGCGAANPDLRNIPTFEVVLTGDLLGNDGPNFLNYGDNSYHVVTYSDPNASNVVLDGCTVRGGNADASGPSITNQGSGVHIRNGNAKCMPGGPTLRNCTFRENFSINHGAVNDHALSTVIENCTFVNNRSNLEGSGLQVHSGSPTVTGCLFFNNTSGGEGGGAWLGTDDDPTCTGPSAPAFTDCTFDGNHAARGGGVFSRGSFPTMDDCTFVGNQADQSGGMIGAGMYNVDGGGTLTGCVFVENTAVFYAGSMYNENASPTLVDCTFDNNAASIIAAGMLNFMNSSPRMHNCRFINTTTTYGAGIINDTNSSPLLTDCVFANNTATNGPGALFNSSNSNPVLINCMFFGNSATLGGVVHNSQSSHPTFINCVMSGNSSLGNAGAIGAYGGSTVHLINTTVVNNWALDHGGGLHLDSISSAIVENSIIWGNSDVTGSGEAAQFDAAPADVSVSHSCVSGWTGAFGGEGNFGNNPLFMDPDGADNVPGTEDDNLRVFAASPTLGAGDGGALPLDVADIDGDGDVSELLPLDLDGNPRVIPPSVDMGAYERYDCNNNGIPDDLDIASGFSEDCNNNAIADECEDDCNNNEVADDCEADSDGDGAIDDCDGCPSDGNKTSPGVCGCGVTDVDSDGDTVPDCVDACPGFDDFVDTDGDTVPDGCDLCEGFDDGLDCNHNSYPDPCEIMDGLVDDVDGNGIPDPCDIAPAAIAIGGRYLTVSPVAATEPVALRITSPDYPCFSEYIDIDGTLTSDPVFQLPEQWAITIVYGAKIIPETTYDVQTEYSGGGESAGTRFTTWKWGDVFHDDVVNLADVQFGVLVFQGEFPELLFAADVEPCLPNGVVNLADVFMSVLAFQGANYADIGCTLPCP